MNNITLQHALVNSNTAVQLPGASISYKWKNQLNANPAVAKYDIVPGSFQGFENPTIIINGTISTVDTSANEINQTHLVNFATLLSNTPITLTLPTSSSGSAEDPFPATPVYLGGRPSGGYKSDGTNVLTNTIKVFITDFSIDIDSGSELGHIWRYNITLQEVY